MDRVTSLFGYLNDGCSIWSEDLFNVEQLKDDDLDRSDFYLKLSASAFLSEDSRRKRWKWFILALAVSMTLALLYVEEDKVAKQRGGFTVIRCWHKYWSCQLHTKCSQ
ncbi:unnamed protein product [Camellia sinensis]